MRILFLAASAVPGAGGVGDYALSLAGRLEAEGHVASVFGVAEAGEGWEERFRAACREFRPDWVSLQFVCYAFDRRGLVRGLGRKLRDMAPGVPWHVMCHELWIGAKRGAPLRERLLGLAQRAAIAGMLRDLRPRRIDTSNAVYRDLLARAGFDAGLLPLFGNIPVAPLPVDGDAALRALLASHGVDLDGPGRDRAFLAGFFGALHPIWPPEPLFSHLARAQEKSGRRTVLVSVGRLGPGRELWARLAREYGDRFAFVALGEQPPALISRLLQHLDCGLATTPWQVIGKSGSAAAMAEHGLPVVVNRTERYGLPSDAAAAPDPLFLRMEDDLPERLLSLPARRAPASRLPEVARRFVEGLAAAPAGGERPLRIAIVSPSFGTYGGIEAFVLALARFLAGRPGFAVRVIWKRAAGFRSQELLERRCRESGVETFTVNRAGGDLWRHLGWADVVHAQNAPPDVVVFARLRGKPLALTIHNYFRAGTWHARLWKRAARLAGARWYNSDFVRRTWEPGGPLPGSRRIPTVSDLPAGELPPERRRGFAFVSRWIPNKGIDVLVRAYARAGLSPEAWPLRLMGDGPLRPEIEALIARERIAGIEITGFVDEARKAELLRSAKWLVVPPHTNEDMGITPLEARSVGVPVIATRDGGLPEAAGADALLCRPADVDDLARCLREAAAMGEDEYAGRSRRARETLRDFLVPLEFYPEAYRRLARGETP